MHRSLSARLLFLESVIDEDVLERLTAAFKDVTRVRHALHDASEVGRLDATLEGRNLPFERALRRLRQGGVAAKGRGSGGRRHQRVSESEWVSGVFAY